MANKIKINALEKRFNNYINSHSSAIAKLNKSTADIYKAIEAIRKCYSLGGKILFFGNGGSAADSQHLAAELVGRYKKDRKALSAIALTTDTSIITSIGNDLNYNKIFQRQVEAIANLNDILFAISTSGKSLNVINAVKTGQKMGIKIISLTGSKSSPLSQLSDISIQVPSNTVNHIQELHILVGHFICEMVEKNYS
tara:strand:- start:237 stop:827 length:591 start_codon:yes stop_codon:yes gene_type:complete